MAEAEKAEPLKLTVALAHLAMFHAENAVQGMVEAGTTVTSGAVTPTAFPRIT